MVHSVELLEALYIPRLLSLSKRYLVIQTYYTGLHLVDTTKPTPVIITAYADQSLAKAHKQTIHNDRLRSVLDLHDDNHRKMILDMIEGTRYLVYWTKLAQ